MHIKSKVFICLILAGITAIPVYAQFELEEVIVTAQRREENLQNVPVSITAFSATQMEQLNITEAKNSDGETESILVGRLEDQSALSGILNSLYEKHLAVLSTECLEKG